MVPGGDAGRDTVIAEAVEHSMYLLSVRMRVTFPLPNCTVQTVQWWA